MIDLRLRCCKRLKQTEIDVGILLANLRHLEEVTGERLEGEDAAMVAQIEREHEAVAKGQRDG